MFNLLLGTGIGIFLSYVYSKHKEWKKEADDTIMFQTKFETINGIIKASLPTGEVYFASQNVILQGWPNWWNKDRNMIHKKKLAEMLSYFYCSNHLQNQFNQTNKIPELKFEKKNPKGNIN